MGHFLKFVFAVCLCTTTQIQADSDRFAAARQKMLAEIQETVTDARRATGMAQPKASADNKRKENEKKKNVGPRPEIKEKIGGMLR